MGTPAPPDGMNKYPGNKKPNPSQIVKKGILDALTGTVLIYPHLALMRDASTIIRKDFNELDCCKLLSGIGSGQEPCMSGFVGKGMLTAAVQGDIFKPPLPSEIFTTIREVTARVGSSLLIIVHNDPSLTIAFGLAMEKAKTLDLNVEIFISRDIAETRKGSAGVVLYQKIAGAMADKFIPLNDITAFLHGLNVVTVELPLKQCVSMLVGHCVCCKGQSDKQTKLGCRAELRDGFAQIIEEVMSLKSVKTFFKHVSIKPSNIVVLVNNMGHSTRIEELIFVRHMLRKLFKMNFSVLRVYCGRYMTSIENVGFSLTFLELEDEKTLEYLDYPTNAPAWNAPVSIDILKEFENRVASIALPLPAVAEIGPAFSATEALNCRVVVEFVCDAIISCESLLNTIDSSFGDGDTGSNMKEAANEIMNLSASEKMSRYPYKMFCEISNLFGSSNGGISSTLHAVLFEAASKAFTSAEVVSADLWLNGLNLGITALRDFLGDPNNTTNLLTPLIVCANEIEQGMENGNTPLDSFYAGVLAAEASLQVRQNFKHVDPGAYAVTIWLRALYEAVKMRVY